MRDIDKTPRCPIDGYTKVVKSGEINYYRMSGTPDQAFSLLNMDLSRFLGWLLLNVAVPLLAPIALLPLLGAGEKYKGRVRELIMRSLQEGQLFWTVIAMCAAASYEAAVHLGELRGTQEDVSIGSTIAWTAIVWHIAVIIISAVLVLLGTMDAADKEIHAATIQTAARMGQTPRIMMVSIWMAAVTAVSFTANHAWAS